MTIHSISPIGEKALKQKTAALIGLSIRNSYFKEDNLQELITWGASNFKQVFLMLPDVPAISTLRSLGYKQKKAKTTAMLACNNLENKCQRIINAHNLSEQVKIVRWRHIEENRAYKTILKDLMKLYQNHEPFKKDLQLTTTGVINKNGTSLPISEALAIGANFILQELACILNAANIFEVPTCAYVYHREMPVHVKILDREYPFKPPQNTGYIIAETDHSAKTKNKSLH